MAIIQYYVPDRGMYWSGIQGEKVSCCCFIWPSVTHFGNLAFQSLSLWVLGSRSKMFPSGNVLRILLNLKLWLSQAHCSPISRPVSIKRNTWLQSSWGGGLLLHKGKKRSMHGMQVIHWTVFQYSVPVTINGWVL